MSNYFYKIIALIVLVLPLSCTNENNSNPCIINPREINKQIDLLKYISDIEYIAFEKNILLNPILDLGISKNSYILRCHERSNLYFFDEKGSFIKQKNFSGPGPQELSNLTDFFHPYQSSKVYLLDSEQSKILTYDLEKDSIINKIDFPGGNIYSFLINDENILIVGTHNDGYIKLLNLTTNELIDKRVYNNFYFNLIKTQNNIIPNESGFIVGASFTDTIYSIDQSKISPYLILGKNETSLQSYSMEVLAKDLLSNGIPSEQYEEVLNPRGFISNLFNNLLIELNQPYKMVVIDMKSYNSSIIDFRNFKNREFIFGYQLFKFLRVEDDFVYSYIFVNDNLLQKASDLALQKNYHESVVQGFESLTNLYKSDKFSYENPVLVKFKVKKEIQKYFYN